MELQSCIEQRRSVRKYKTQPVPREQLREIIQAAIFAPSWKNSQTSRYYVAEGEAKAELEKCLAEFKGCTGAHCVNGRYKTFRFYTRRRI